MSLHEMLLANVTRALSEGGNGWRERNGRLNRMDVARGGRACTVANATRLRLLPGPTAFRSDSLLDGDDQPVRRGTNLGRGRKARFALFQQQGGLSRQRRQHLQASKSFHLGKSPTTLRRVPRLCHYSLLDNEGSNRDDGSDVSRGDSNPQPRPWRGALSPLSYGPRWPEKPMSPATTTSKRFVIRGTERRVWTEGTRTPNLAL